MRSRPQREEAPARPYRALSCRLGLRPGLDLEGALRLAGELEDAETLRELALRR